MASISSGLMGASISRVYYSKATGQVALSMDGEHGGFTTIWFDEQEAGKLASQIVEAYTDLIKHRMEKV